MKNKKSNTYLTIKVAIITILVLVSFRFIVSFINKRDDVKYTESIHKIMTSMKYSREIENINNSYIYSNIEDTTEFENDILKIIERMNSTSYKLFGEVSEHPLSILLYSSEEEFKIKTKGIIPSNSKGLAVYDGVAMHIIVSKLQSDTFAHEYLHFKTHSFCKDNKLDFYDYPVWFIEGIAELSEDYFGINTSPIYLDKVNKFKKMDNRMRYDKSYLQSHLGILKVIEMSGYDAVKNIMLNTRNKGFYNAFKGELGISIAELEKSLKLQSKSNPNESGKKLNTRIKELENYTRVYSKDSKALQLLANYYWNAGNYKKSEGIYYRSLQLDPNNIITLNQLAMMYEEMSRKDEADDIRRKIDLIKNGEGF